MIYLTAGHTVVNGRGTGAFGINGFDEAVEALKLVNDISVSLKDLKTPVINDIPTDPLAKVVLWLKSKVGASDIVVEIHFNAAASPEATGVECYVDDTPTTKELRLAREIAMTIASTLGLKLRGPHGVKKESDSQHSSLAIISGPAAATNVLVEVCFITCQKDVTAYRKNYWKLVDSLALTLSIASK